MEKIGREHEDEAVLGVTPLGVAESGKNIGIVGVNLVNGEIDR
jgi:hypothetical protein